MHFRVYSGELLRLGEHLTKLGTKKFNQSRGPTRIAILRLNNCFHTVQPQ